MLCVCRGQPDTVPSQRWPAVAAGTQGLVALSVHVPAEHDEGGARRHDVGFRHDDAGLQEQW